MKNFYSDLSRCVQEHFTKSHQTVKLNTILNGEKLKKIEVKVIR